MSKVLFLFRSGVLAHTQRSRALQTAACKLTDLPKCAACQYGKQRRRALPGKTSTAVRDSVGALRKDDLLPGQRVSCDHFQCSTRGRLFTSRGKTHESSMYIGGAIFSDLASKYISVVLQANLTTQETLQAKDQFERMARDYGVVVQQYVADNGSSFTSKAFTEHLSTFAQVIRFAGVGAHHQNISERDIQTIMSIARCNMLHSAIHWPEMADTQFWPQSVMWAVYVFNRCPPARYRIGSDQLVHSVLLGATLVP